MSFHRQIMFSCKPNFRQGTTGFLKDILYLLLSNWNYYLENNHEKNKPHLQLSYFRHRWHIFPAHEFIGRVSKRCSAGCCPVYARL